MILEDKFVNYKDKKDKIISYMKKGETNKENFKIGIEMEHFSVDKESLISYDYFGENGVGDTLNKLKDIGFSEVSEEDGYILGLREDDIAINLEPAGQFELAIDAKKYIRDLEDSYKKIAQEIIPIYEKKGQYLTSLGYHPKSKIKDFEIIPKDRYKYMQEYFKKFGGPRALNMMRGTASVQTALDYESEEDFKVKFFVANALSPFIYTLYDNAYIFEGKPYEYKNLRQEIWELCDPQRTGVYEFSFDYDLSYGKYAEKILNTDIIFINKDGQDVYKGDTKFKDIMDEDSSDEMIFHAMSIVFPDVRAKRYIEVRMPDAVPYPYNLSFPALLKGLFYDEENLKKLGEIFSDMTYEICQDIKKKTHKEGLFAKYKDKFIYEWLEDLIKMAKDGLDGDEKSYLDPIENLIKERETLRDKFEKLYRKDPKEAIKRSSLNYALGGLDGQA